jgi:arabinogalactan endo-1,4-beta-galactosidase
MMMNRHRCAAGVWNRTRASAALILLAILLAWLFIPGIRAGGAPATTVPSAGRTGPFIIGADISWIPEDEAAGATYFDHGVQKDIFQILKEHGFNYIRLRVFVDPGSDRGYAAGMSQTFCDLEHTKAMAKRIKAAGMGFLLDFHYSDYWADPGKQIKPAAWENYTVPQLVQAVHDHTHTVVAALKDQGTPPDMVQTGNEIRPGMLWPEGRVGLRDKTADESQWDNLAAMLKAGIAAVKEVDPSIKIVLHNDAGFNDPAVRWWVDHLLARDVQFDIIGLSCYRQDKEGDWPRTFNDLAARYPNLDVMVCEYSSRKQYVNDAMFNVPGKKGLGTFIWEPTRHKEAIFDQNGRNAGGGEAYYYNTTVPAGAFPRPATRPTGATRSTTRPNIAAGQFRRPRTGGRYDTNDLIDIYPRLAHQYGND